MSIPSTTIVSREVQNKRTGAARVLQVTLRRQRSVKNLSLGSVPRGSLMGALTCVLRVRHWSQTTALERPSGTADLRFLFRRAAVASAVERIGCLEAPACCCPSPVGCGLVSEELAAADGASLLTGAAVVAGSAVCIGVSMFCREEIRSAESAGTGRTEAVQSSRFKTSPEGCARCS